ncbi:MAG: DNA polymerase III subunit beta [Bdellovibrionaceae bacterium]|nr:DNA polymerase III subunit beta [Pseudobdellovibrionaceae bacterium]
MKLEIEKKDLVSLLSKTQNVVEKRNSMPVLVNVLFEAKKNKLKVFATDLEVSLTDEAPANIKEEGTLAISARNLFDIVKELNEGPILLTKKKNNWLEIKQHKSVFNLVGLSAEEYPVFPTFKTTDFIKINSKTFAEMIERTIYSVSNDETRYHLNGVFFEKKKDNSKISFRMVATDGHRLSLVERPLEKGVEESLIPAAGVIIPRKGLNEIKKILDTSMEDVEMAFEGSQLIIKSGSTVLMVRLIEGKYPNYQQLIPQQMKKHASINRETFLGSIRRVSLLSNHKSKGITFNLTKGKLEISSNNPELGDAKEEIDVDYSGEDLKIGFNAKYIMDILNSFEDSSLELALDSQLSPGLIRPENDKSYTCVVMPMRI